ncbi:MAG: TonB-dependent receptor [Bryobacterales bacterium]|nr:TonB-dependent receptor [Bryobacterales bacterium]
MKGTKNLKSLGQGLCLALTVLALLAVPAWPQSSTGSVRGTVQDPTGAVIPNVTVALTNTATGVEIKTVSNETGFYVFPSVNPGPYRIEAELAGMQKFEATITVQVQQSTNIPITLQPAGTQTIVSVQDVTPMLTSDSATMSHTLERTRIEQLPINGRFVGNLLATVPGFTQGGDGWRFDGNRTGTFDVVLDGAALTDQLYGGGTVSRPPSLDSIQEFSVIVNSSSAKYTRPNTVIMTTKGGTNAIHGTLFETNRDNFYGVARARDNFTGVVSKLVRNEFGGTVGGPVSIPKIYNGKNKSFWFFNYEGLKERRGTQNNYRVPNLTTRRGDFSDLVDTAGKMTVIYDPLTSGPGPLYLRQPFNYGGKINNIDPSRLSPFMKYIYSILPEPNIAGVNGYLGNNFYGNAPQIQNEYTWGARFDHRFSDKDLVYGRITKAMKSVSRPAANGVPSLDGFGNSRNDTMPNQSMSLDWTHTFSPTFFNEFMFSASRTVTTQFSGDYTRFYTNELGLPNPGNQPGYPVVNNIGVGTGNSNYFQPVNWNQQFFNYFIMEDNGTKIKGKHEIQYGMHLRLDQLTYMPQQQRTAGNLTFAAVTTGLYDPVNSTATSRAMTNYTGHVAAAAYLGYSGYEVRVAKGKYYMRQKEDSFYIQDNWRATRRLTLNLGLRWQFSPYPNDKYYIMSSYSKKDNAIVLGNKLDTFYKIGAASPAFINVLTGYGMKFMTYDQAGLPQTLVKNNWKDISPHLGFAYRAFDGRKSFVLRGGYALNYMLIPIYGWNDRMRMNTPFAAFYQNYQLTDGAQSPAGDGINNWGLINAPTIVAGKNSANAVTFDKPMGITPGTESFQNAYFNPDQPTSRVHDWNLTLEKEVMRDTVLRVSYVGNKAAKQDSYDDWNQSMPDYVWMMTRKLLPLSGTIRNYGARAISAGPYGNLQEYRKDGWSWANGIKAEFERRFSRGFGFQIMYQLFNTNKAAGHGWYSDSQVSPVSSFLPAEQIPDRNKFMKTYMYKRDTNVPHDELRWNWIVDLPFGKGKKILGHANRFLDAFIGGWQVSSMGRWGNRWIGLTTGSSWPTGEKVKYNGRNVPIQDCTSGVCRNAFLMWNGYIPAYLINSVDATGKPNGYMGIPSDYKPAVAPLWPYPADYRSRTAANDPNFANYGTSYIWLPVTNQAAPVRFNLSGTDSNDPATSPVHPFNGMSILGAGNWNFDTALFKSFRITEQAKLRVQCDFFNTFNHPGDAASGMIASNYGSQNGARVLQLSMRLSW